MGATLSGFVISGDLSAEFGYREAALWFCGPALVLMALPYFAQPRNLKKTKSPDGEEPIGLAAFVTAFKHRRFVRVLLIFAGSQMSFTVMRTSFLKSPYSVAST